MRSGAAPGCDTVAEIAADKAINEGHGSKEIYLPWKGFNDNNSPFYTYTHLHEEIAFKYHPNLYGQKDSTIKLMTRNSAQVLGQDCKTRTAFVACYCPVKNGVEIGGTSQAIRVAKAYSIPIYNIFYPEQYMNLKEVIENL